MQQLTELARPFPEKAIERNPSGGGQFVKHSLVNERLLATVGPFSFEIIEVLRGYVPAKPPDPNAKSKRGKEGSPALENAVVGCIGRMTLTIDGRTVVSGEVGDCEDPHNWPHDGARLKDAASDAFKRCAMREGVGLHLWSQGKFSLYTVLSNKEKESNGNGDD